jgi:FtsP/CotA-like multicopper oxidase with cupredoxin domain
MKRRNFIQNLSSTTLLASSAPFIGGLANSMGASAANASVNTHQIIAEPAMQKIGDESAPKTSLWLYNATSPGPELRLPQGERLSVSFVNRLPEPTTIHWHGIRNENSMDGVPDITQAPVEPGARFHYDFIVPDAGTYWFHAHVNGWKQMAKGLYGPLIVDGADDPDVDHDLVWMADDWRLDDGWQIDEASFGSLHDWSHQGRLGNWLTVNGQSRFNQPVKPNSRIRLRLINAANARVFKFQFADDVTATLIATDGAPSLHTLIDNLTLAPAQRADLIIDIGETVLILDEISAGSPVRAGTLTPDPAMGMGKFTNANLMQPALPAPPDIAKARRVNIHMQGGAMGNLSEAVYEGETLGLRELAQSHQKLWAFNGEVGGNSLWLAEAELGQPISLDVYNDTAWPHGMHLHGHHFWVIGEDGKALSTGKRDTHLINAGEKASLLFVADNPGLWLFHCHMMAHHAAGMGGVIAVL